MSVRDRILPRPSYHSLEAKITKGPLSHVTHDYHYIHAPPLREGLVGGPPFHPSGSPALLRLGDGPTGSGLALIPSPFLFLLFIAHIIIAEMLQKYCRNANKVVLLHSNMLCSCTQCVNTWISMDICRWIWIWSDNHAHGQFRGRGRARLVDLGMDLVLAYASVAQHIASKGVHFTT